LSRKRIPDATKVAVRKRCGFGCVLCGDPECDYHHIIHHSSGGMDDAENLVMLCPSHHSSYHRGTIPQSVIKRFSDSPFSKTKTPLKYLHLDLSSFIPVMIGSIGFGINESIQKKKLDLIRFSNGYTPFSIEIDNDGIFLDVDLRTQTGEPLLTITRNNLTYSKNLHDFYFKANSIILENKNGSKVFHAIIESDRIFIRDISILHNGTLFVADSENGNLTFSSDQSLKYGQMSGVSFISENTDLHSCSISIPANKIPYPLEKSLREYTETNRLNLKFRKKLQKIYDANRCLPLHEPFRFF
jgi:hypothetical protein